MPLVMLIQSSPVWTTVQSVTETTESTDNRALEKFKYSYGLSVDSVLQVHIQAKKIPCCQRGKNPNGSREFLRFLIWSAK